MKQRKVRDSRLVPPKDTLLSVLPSIVKMTDLGEQRRSRGAQVVGDEQLGVGVNPRWVELPQWLGGGVGAPRHMADKCGTYSRVTLSRLRLPFL